MNRPFILAVIPLISALLLLLGCIQPVDRPGNSPNVNGPSPTAPLATTPTTSPTPIPPVPTPTLGPTPTLPSAPTATPTPTLPPLFLDLLQPDFGSTVRTSTVTVAGLTVPAATVEVNSRVVTADETGSFEAEVALEPGQNVIVVEAIGADGERTRDFLTLVYLPPPPPEFFLLVEEPTNGIIVVNQIVRVAGRTIPQATVTVNGVGVGVNAQGEFETLVQLQPLSNTIEVTARDPDGRAITATRRVIYSP